MNKNLLNIIVMQIGWWGVTLNYQSTLLYSSITIALITFHILFCTVNKSKEMLFMLVATVVGCGVDFLAIKLSFFTPTTSTHFFPIWLICYWALFTTSFSLSLNWLKSKGYLASFLVLFFAPLTYYAGERFNILIFNPEKKIIAMLSYGLLWAMHYPLLFRIHTRINSR